VERRAVVLDQGHARSGVGHEAHGVELDLPAEEAAELAGHDRGDPAGDGRARQYCQGSERSDDTGAVGVGQDDLEHAPGRQDLYGGGRPASGLQATDAEEGQPSCVPG
jgi:hypothetical protein